MSRTGLAVAMGLAAALATFGQNVISARAGLIHHVEGKVLLEGTPVEVKYTQFPEVKEGQQLVTEDGRAEVLLSPGSFLRLGENSSFRMASSRLTDIQFEVLSGTALVEVAELSKEDHITVSFMDRTVSVHKNGLYRFDSEPALFRVYEGEAVIGDGREALTVKKGKQVALDSKMMVADKFDPKVGDELYRWASRRAGYLSMANVASAKSIVDRGGSWSTSGWYFNPWYQMFTFIPYRGSYWSPFGFGFYSPTQIYSSFYPRYYGGGGGGYYGNGTTVHSGHTSTYDPSLGYNVGTRSAGVSSRTGGIAASPAGSSSGAAAASAPSGRGGADAGGRGASSGGGRGGHN